MIEENMMNILGVQLMNNLKFQVFYGYSIQ